jgi:CHAT domain-containing protein/Tfp pilus assembly protein PilF
VAEALTRLAELHQWQGHWGRALGRRREALVVRERQDGDDHPQTTDARLALAFTEKVAGLGKAERARAEAALRQERDAARLEAQRKYEDSEHAAMAALETFRALVGPESAEVARMWHGVGRCRVGHNDLRGAIEASLQSLAIRRRILPRNHRDLGESLRQLGIAEGRAGNLARSRELLEEAVGVSRISPGLGPSSTAAWLMNLGDIQYSLRDYAAARGSYEEALAIRRRAFPPGHLDIATSLNNLGTVQRNLQEFAAARGSYEEALAIRRRALHADHPDIATSLYNLGFAQDDLRDYAAARASQEEALAIRRRTLPADHPQIAVSLNNLGAVQDRQRDYPAARASHEEALAIRRRALPPDHPYIAASLYNLGVVQSHLRDYPAARASYEAALAIQRRSLPADHPDIARSLYNLGSVQRDLRDHAAARASYEAALAIQRRSIPPNPLEIAASLNDLGNVQFDLRDYAAARASQEEALAIRRRSLPPDHPDIARSLNNLANVQAALRDYAALRASHEAALAILRRSLAPDHPDIAQSLANLGVAQRNLMDYAAARASQEEALAIRRRSLPPDHPDIATSLIWLGVVHDDLRDDAAARRSYEEALAIQRRSNPPDHAGIAAALNNLGVLQYHMRDYAGARASHEEALASRRRSLPPDHPEIATSLYNLGVAQRQLREFAAARASHEEALVVRRRSLPPDHPDTTMSLYQIALDCLESETNVPDAVTYLTEACDIKIADQLRIAVAQAEQEQFSTAAGTRRLLRLLIDAVITNHCEPGLAYDRLVRVQGSVTAQQRWARQVRDSADPETARLLADYRHLTQQIVGLSAGDRPREGISAPQDAPTLVRNYSTKRAEIERQLTARSPAYRTFQHRSRAGAAQVRASLPKGAALVHLVEYFHVVPLANGEAASDEARDRFAAFVLRPDRQEVTLVPLGPTEELTRWIEQWRGSYGVGRRPSPDGADPGVELRKRLWEPLAEHLSDIKVVLVSPDGPLNGLPWAALPGSRQGNYLIHDRAFAVVTVPQLLPELIEATPERDDVPPSLLLAGGISYGRGNARIAAKPSDKLPPTPLFGPLYGAEREVDDLQAQFITNYPDVPAPKKLVAASATKEAVLMALPSHRFVHLATHGFFADESEESVVTVAQRAELLRGGIKMQTEAAGRHPGLLSGLVFAGVNLPEKRPEETILTALEATELDLGKVQLVVLSACETGLGRVAGGEGVLGLQRAFQLAGARSVVASLWRVPDEETHQLMREFYRRVWSDTPVAKAEALRQAQLWMLENWKPRRGLGEPRGGLERSETVMAPPPYVWGAFVLSGDWR